VIDLADALNRMGPASRGPGTDELRIEGVTTLRPLDHTVIADRIEAGTFMVAGPFRLRRRGARCVAATSRRSSRSCAPWAPPSPSSRTASAVHRRRPARGPVDLRTSPHARLPDRHLQAHDDWSPQASR